MVYCISLSKNVIPYCGPTIPQGIHDFNKLEFSLSEDDASTQVLSFLVHWFLKKKYFNNTKTFSCEVTFYLNKLKSFFPQDCFVPNLGKINHKKAKSKRSQGVRTVDNTSFIVALIGLRFIRS